MGNLGRKLLQHLSSHPQVSHVVGLDLQTPKPQEQFQLQGLNDSGKVDFFACDLLDWNDRRWRNQLEKCDTVVHFAAQNPFPEATWDDANASLDMTMNLTLAAVDSGLERVIFVSSNHVMGRYFEEPLASTIGPGDLTTDLEHAVGTRWLTGGTMMDSTVYATAKSSGERLCHVLACRSARRTSFVCIRVGWCQPGENLPTTLSAAGTPTQTIQSSDQQEMNAAEQWFKNMWLSNRDFIQLFEKAIFANHDRWPNGSIVVNGMSANAGMKWSLKEGLEFLNYRPVDNVNA
jgi:nucleoside-diphosphate-sugar epimerase